jgi:hypothetical protein
MHRVSSEVGVMRLGGLAAELRSRPLGDVGDEGAAPKAALELALKAP